MKIERHEAILKAVEKFGEYIKNEVLANSLELVETVSGEKIELFEGVLIGIEVRIFQ